jgi:hypothetical protein
LGYRARPCLSKQIKKYNKEGEQNLSKNWLKLHDERLMRIIWNHSPNLLAHINYILATHTSFVYHILIMTLKTWTKVKNSAISLFV